METVLKLCKIVKHYEQIVVYPERKNIFIY